MKLLSVLLVPFALLSWISASHAAQVDFSALSQCTLTCLLNTFAAENCSLTDINCQCKNEQLTAETSACMLSNCTLADSLALGTLQQQVCDVKPQSRASEIVTIHLVLATLAFIAVVLRLLSRYLISKTIYNDDIAMLAAVVFLVPNIIFVGWMSTHGLGKNTWNVSASNVTKIMQLFWVGETFYVLTLLLTKVSLLLFYLRIFPSRRFQIWGKLGLGFVILPATIIMLLQLLQCLPVQYNWDKTIHNPKCINVNALTYAHAGINIAQDFVILALPIPELLHLKLDLQQKIGLIVMFQVGIFACITSIVRLRFLAQFGVNSIDPLYENSDVVIWTSAETNTAIICSCLPAIRALYKTGRHIASEAASGRRTRNENSRRQYGKSSQLQSNDHDPRFVEPRSKAGEVVSLHDMGDTTALVSSPKIGRAV
ncbi:hypothetical protein LTR84_008959 [Exophiala bonariae]|uniref:CFEM domain-containing protein n=1 Tax=Exophiala bonariae TaxID=1690606 RepID=A0AAV9MYZ6_9EURO|nr:hypothetical protein LTR84_008959 [Exophiala bonariae]